MPTFDAACGSQSIIRKPVQIFLTLNWILSAAHNFLLMAVKWFNRYTKMFIFHRLFSLPFHGGTFHSLIRFCSVIATRTYHQFGRKSGQKWNKVVMKLTNYILRVTFQFGSSLFRAFKSYSKVFNFNFKQSLLFGIEHTIIIVHFISRDTTRIEIIANSLVSFCSAWIYVIANENRIFLNFKNLRHFFIAKC